MATRFFSLLLTAAASSVIFSAPVIAQAPSGNDTLEDIVAPDLERRDVRQAKIDTENWEIGVYGGLMSIEDFGNNSSYGARLAYHITEGLFIEASYGLTTAGKTSFEELSGSTQILTDDQRDITYYSAAIGYNLFQGEIFVGSKRAYNTNFYVLAGAGTTEFADDDYFTYTLGVGTRLFISDWFAVHGDIRAHSFNHELLGEEKTIINFEPNLGFTIFF